MQTSDTVGIYPDLAGKVAVVTGGSGGIGAATCRLLAANGARVAVNGRDQEKIAVVVDAIGASGGEAIGVTGDCTDLAAVERLRQQVEHNLGPAEVLAAFVGGGRARPGPVADVLVEDWQSTVDGSLTATFLTLKSFLPGMIQRGRGAIVTMASSAARLPGLGAPAPYVAGQGGGGHAHPPGRQRGRPPWNSGELPGPAHHPDRADPAGSVPGEAGQDGGGDPAGTAWDPRRRRPRGRVPGL
jgi:3-oxoacyl-[acyl-carrier protein] reductase